MAYRGVKYDRDPVAARRRQTAWQVVVLMLVLLATMVLVWAAMTAG